MHRSALQRAVPMITETLTSKTGITFRWGHPFATSGREIALPALPENIHQEHKAKIIGGLYHECAHIVEGDFQVTYENPFHQMVAQMLEETRIERIQMSKIAGARSALNGLIDVLASESDNGTGSHFLPVADYSVLPVQHIVRSYFLTAIRYRVLQYRSLRERAEAWEAAMQKNFPPSFLAELDVLVMEAVNSASEGALTEVSLWIVALFAAHAQNIAARSQSGADDDKGQETEEDSGGDDSGAVSEENGGSTDGDTKSNGTSQPSESQGSEKEAGSQSSPSVESDVEQLGAIGDPAQATAGAGAQPGDDIDWSQYDHAAVVQLLGMGANEIPPTIHDVMVNLFKSMDPVSTDPTAVRMPMVVPLTGTAQNQINLSDVAAASNALAMATRSWLNSLAETGEYHAFRGVRVDPLRFHHFKLGRPVFIQSDEVIDINSEISILLDASTSMESIMHLALESAMACTLAFKGRGLSTQLSVFPACDKQGQEHVAIVKGWEESHLRASERLPSVYAQAYTPMAEAMYWASMDLLRRRSDARQILLVVTDGVPWQEHMHPDDCMAQAKYIVSRAREAGISVLGLGIGEDVTELFGDYSASVSGINELAGSMIQLIRSVIR